MSDKGSGNQELSINPDSLLDYGGEFFFFRKCL